MGTIRTTKNHISRRKTGNQLEIMSHNSQYHRCFTGGRVACVALLLVTMLSCVSGTETQSFLGYLSSWIPWNSTPKPTPMPAVRESPTEYPRLLVENAERESVNGWYCDRGSRVSSDGGRSWYEKDDGCRIYWHSTRGGGWSLNPPAQSGVPGSYFVKSRAPLPPATGWFFRDNSRNLTEQA